LWFEEQELRWAKDDTHEDMKWLDVDLWKDKEKFKISRGIRGCPTCRVPLYEVYYGDSGTVVDVCNLCHGIWLDRGEFKKIMAWVRREGDEKLIKKKAKSLFEEMAEVFTGPEPLREEIEDVLTVVSLLRYRFMALHPVLTQFVFQMLK